MSAAKPEVLSPAGSPAALSAAVGAGADAVYFGLTDFNARIRARNFDLGDLPDILLDLRRWGVKSYLVFNTLVFAAEMTSARDLLEAVATAGPDGLIVQDLGVLRLARQVAPEIAVHASTQMTVASPDGVRMAARLGARRVILARELTLDEIRRIRASVETELEVFVHGALCVSYSGQCLSSEAWGGRSANRGQCAQACRLPYDLIVDGRPRNLGDRAYLLSPRDLEGFRRVPELTALGIAAFKIEGRMKSPEYVAAATALYRAAVDRAWVDTDSFRVAAGGDEGGGTAPRSASPESLAQAVRQVFNRGSSEGFLGGINHQVLVDGTTRAHRGVRAGTVLRVEAAPAGGGAVVIETWKPADAAAGTRRGDSWGSSLEDPPVRLKPGDGILLAVSAREEDEVGGSILSVEPLRRPDHLVIRFPRVSSPDLRRVRPGTPVYRTGDPLLVERLRESSAHPERTRSIPLTVHAEAAPGRPLRLVLSDPDGHRVEVESSMACEPAVRHRLDADALRAQLERTGHTRYRLAVIETKVEGNPFLPMSELNRLRREAVARMEALRGRRAGGEAETAPRGGDAAAVEAVEEGRAGPLVSPVLWALDRAGQEPVEEGTPAESGPPGGPDAFEDGVIILCRDLDQVRGALDAGARRVALDFLDLVGLKEAATELRTSGIRRMLALPRVQKPGEERIESFFLGLGPEEILVRSLGSVERLGRLQQERGPAARFPVLVGDVSLNAVNPDSIEVLTGLGLSRVAPGLDLNGEQLQELVSVTDAGRLEIPLYHHLPVFHTEHCVFAAFLSDGADFRSCGRPCDRHRLALRDRTGQSHPVVADVGCRNTVFGARPQSAGAHLAALRRAGVRHFRIELISQDRAATARVIGLHRAAWERRIDWGAAQRELQADSAYGLSTGSPEPPRARRGKAPGQRAKPRGAGMPRRSREAGDRPDRSSRGGGRRSPSFESTSRGGRPTASRDGGGGAPGATSGRPGVPRGGGRHGSRAERGDRPGQRAERKRPGSAPGVRDDARRRAKAGGAPSARPAGRWRDGGPAPASRGEDRAVGGGSGLRAPGAGGRVRGAKPGDGRPARRDDGASARGPAGQPRRRPRR